MERIAVESKTGMCGYAYDPVTQTLEIAFKPKNEGEPEKVYHYSNVSQSDYDKFANAESKGSHFLKFIRPCFPCERQHIETCKKGCSLIDEPLCACWCHTLTGAKGKADGKDKAKAQEA
jgi:hypothetical protein